MATKPDRSAGKAFKRPIERSCSIFKHLKKAAHAIVTSKCSEDAFLIASERGQSPVVETWRPTVKTRIATTTHKHRPASRCAQRPCVVLLPPYGLAAPSTSAPKLTHLSLLYLPPTTSSADLSKQKALVAKERDGFQSRDIVVVYVIGQRRFRRAWPRAYRDTRETSIALQSRQRRFPCRGDRQG